MSMITDYESRKSMFFDMLSEKPNVDLRELVLKINTPLRTLKQWEDEYFKDVESNSGINYTSNVDNLDNVDKADGIHYLDNVDDVHFTDTKQHNTTFDEPDVENRDLVTMYGTVDNKEWEEVTDTTLVTEAEQAAVKSIRLIHTALDALQESNTVFVAGELKDLTASLVLTYTTFRKDTKVIESGTSGLEAFRKSLSH